MKRRVFITSIVFCLALVLTCGGCKDKSSSKRQEVVVYTSLDKVFSQPVLEEFEKQTGIKVLDIALFQRRQVG